MLQLILSLESLGSRVYVTNIGLGTLQTTINGHGHLRVKIFQQEENKNTRIPCYCYVPNGGSSSSSTSLQRNFLTSQAISVVKLGESRQLIRRRFSSMIIPGAVTLSRSTAAKPRLKSIGVQPSIVCWFHRDSPRSPVIFRTIAGGYWR